MYKEINQVNPVSPKSNPIMDDIIGNLNSALNRYRENIFHLESKVGRIYSFPEPKSDADVEKKKSIDNIVDNFRDLIDTVNYLNDRFERSNSRLDDIV